MDWHELRHWRATHLVTDLGLPFPDAAEQLGHTDGGALLAKLYFHADKERALDKTARALEREAMKPARIEDAPERRGQQEVER